MTAAICFHCSGVGSVPVGLCAQAWRTKMENSGAFWGEEGYISSDRAEIPGDGQGSTGHSTGASIRLGASISHRASISHILNVLNTSLMCYLRIYSLIWMVRRKSQVLTYQLIRTFSLLLLNRILYCSSVSPTSRSFRKPWRSSPLFSASQ